VAELSGVPRLREQLSTIARIRWQLFINSLRTLRGRLELVSHIFVAFGFGLGGITGLVACGVGSWYVVSHGKSEWLAAVLWPIFLFWQLFPVAATAFSENFDTSNLLRFPLSYPAFFMIRVAYGSLEPATILGSLWLLGSVAGIAAASAKLLPWAAFVGLLFAAMNVLLSRMIFSWVERWLAQRRTREILGVLFLFFVISFQLVGPLMSRYGSRSHPEAQRIAQRLLPVQRLLPPGAAASGVTGATNGDFLTAAEGVAALAVYCAIFFFLLNARLHAQFLGENLSEAAARSEVRRGERDLALGWNLPAIPGPVAAIFEKELRYLSRSGPMLFTLIMPVFILFVFRLTPSSAHGGSASFLDRFSDMAFPIGAGYALLVLTNLVYNNFGPEGAGVQTYFTAPVPIRSVMIGKNLAHAAVLALEMLLVWAGATLIYTPPSFPIFLTTVAGLLFALPMNLAAGNLLSISSPKRIDFGTFGRQRASNTTVFASFGVQIVVVGLAAGTIIAARMFGRIWLATVVFLILAGVAWVIYWLILGNVDRIMFDHREEMVAELTRVS